MTQRAAPEHPPSDQPPRTPPRYVKVADLRAEGDDDSCLRPLGMCELGGCCDVCCYSPENRRKREVEPGGR